MEEIQTENGKPRAVRIVVVLALVAFLVTCAVIATGRFLRGYSLRDALSPEVPVLELHVAFFDTTAPKRSSSDSTSAAESTSATPASEADMSFPTATPNRCPDVIGGDLGATPPRRRPYRWEATPVPCPLVATWRVLRNPVASSLFLVRGADALAWYDSNPHVTALRQSALWNGLVRQVADVLKVRAEELQLDDWKGEFLQPLIRDALAADASFHYDLVHGAGGFVFAFDRTKAHIVDKALPVVIRGLATTAYTAEGYEQPLIGIRLYGRLLYLTQKGNRVVIGSSLEGLLNVLSQNPFTAPLDRGSVIAVFRPESFMDKLLVSSVGAPEWPLSISFELSATTSELSGAAVPRARIFDTFAPRIASGVLAALPHDAMAAIALSADLPLGKPVAEWNVQTTRPVDSSGLGLVWDVSGKEKRFDVGLAVLAPSGPDVAVRPGDFISSKGVSTACAGGAVWIAASSDALLGRMKASCEKQSLSIRDLRGLQQSTLEEQQLSLVFNAAVWLQEMFALGVALDSENDAPPPDDAPREASQAPEQQARLRIQKMVDELAPKLPILGLTGRLEGATSGLRLKGFMSTHEGV